MTGRRPPRQAAGSGAPLTVIAHYGGAGLICLAVTGEVDMATSGALRDAVLGALRVEGVRELVVDLHAVTFLAAVGITALLAGQWTAARCGVGYRVVNPRGIVYRVLDVTDTLSPLTEPAAA